MKKAYVMDKNHRAQFNKSGNIKLGNTWNFSTVYGDSLKSVTFNGKKYESTGTCGGHCSGCKNDCYVKKSYRYPSVVFSHIRNTIAIRTNPDAAFHDLDAAIENAKTKPEIIRVNQSGELENVYIFRKWCELAAKHPDITFWLYTKAYEIVINDLLAGTVPENMTILFSIWHKYGSSEFKKVMHLKNVKAFVYDDNYNYKADGIQIQTYCKAYTMQAGKMSLNHNITCDKCKKCFNRSAGCKVIGSLPH